MATAYYVACRLSGTADQRIRYVDPVSGSRTTYRFPNDIGHFQWHAEGWVVGGGKGGTGEVEERRV
jgi:hypothetical protein